MPETPSDSTILDVNPVPPAPKLLAGSFPPIFVPLAGTQITSSTTQNTYTFGEKIGEGFFSDVYSCRDVWDNDLAVKVLKPLLPLDSLREACVREFQTLLTVRHPHVTHIYDAFEFNSAFFIVTERCLGSIESLFQMQRLDGMTWLMPIARCLLQAVHSLHTMGIVHQDIHPGNVMSAIHKDELLKSADGTWHFKLCDLGVARLHTELAATELRKVSIMPPELLDTGQFGPIDHRIDIYHCGLLLLQLAMSKRLEFTAVEILSGKPRELALKLPAPYSLALEKALRRRVQYRTASALELWRDLRSAVLDGT